jgi:uncharacterized protein (DUF4415 family)
MVMSKEGKKKQSKTDWEKLRSLKDDEIDLSEIPELTDEMWAGAEVGVLAKKIPLSIRLDEDVVAWFRAQGDGYQTRINEVLKHFVKVQSKAAPINASALPAGSHTKSKDSLAKIDAKYGSTFKNLADR